MYPLKDATIHGTLIAAISEGDVKGCVNTLHGSESAVKTTMAETVRVRREGMKKYP